jgi:hypothetical protein
MNAMTLGEFGKINKKLGQHYDEIFHLALVVSIEINGQLKNIVVEKEATINISTQYKTNENTQILFMPSLKNKSLTLNKMLETTREKIGNEKYFSYNAFGNNCQNYIFNILYINNEIDQKMATFIFQDSLLILKELPKYTSYISNFFTGFKGFLDKITGKGH